MFRPGTIVLLSLLTSLVLFAPSPASAEPAPGAAYSITNPSFQTYFDRRGGARVLGQPISREFDLLGSRVQFFQRAVLQQRSDGSVVLLNILDEGFLPYTHIYGMTFPVRDPALEQAAPSPSDPDFPRKALAFVQVNAPDDWEGMKPNFYSTFISTVTREDAFPGQEVDESQVNLINLEMWGLPTSKPSFDPRFGDLIYQRFQRGILYFNISLNETKWLPVGEYLKTLITWPAVSPDLEQEAGGSRMYRQYDNGMARGIVNPSSLPNTNLFAAFERDWVLVPQPVSAETPAPTPVPNGNAAVTKPDWIEIKGSEWFVAQTEYALALVPDTVRDYIYKIEQVNDRSRFDIPNRTLYVIEADAFIPGWRDDRDGQVVWYAGWIIHSAVHGEQHWGGRPTTGAEAEREALLRQQDFLVRNDDTSRPFIGLVTGVINGKYPGFGEWSRP